ncbi:MAG: NAD-dependent epimerase/dehydratase family protein [Azonexus sp.]|nr:NAD-dependent epimerase/dehydratase family protein [Azonexus sp.]
MAACLVVGGGGFIGSHLVAKLVASGRKDVRVLGRSSRPRFSLPEGVSYVSGDICNEQFLRPLLQDCDEVFDLAYSTVPKTSFEDPVLDVMANLPANVTLIKLASECRLRRFVLVSSGGTVYGNATYLPIDESHPTNPVSPYGITKLAAEKYALMFHRLGELPVVIVRPANPYGPNQLGNLGQGFVGAALFALLNHKPVTIFGARGTVRDYIYVEDLADGLVAALDHGVPGNIYNIGTGLGFDNRMVLDEIVRVSDQLAFALEVVVQPERAFDVATNVLSSAKLTYVSGWRPKTEFAQGMAKTWAWALQNGLRK